MRGHDLTRVRHLGQAAGLVTLLGENAGTVQLIASMAERRRAAEPVLLRPDPAVLASELDRAARRLDLDGLEIRASVQKRGDLGLE